DQASRPLGRIGLEKIADRRKLLGMQPDCPQQSRDRIAKLGIVIDEQNTWICVTHPRHPALGKKRTLHRNSAILRTMRQDEQYLLHKRTAGELSHRLRALSLHSWGMSLTLEIACRRESLPPVGWSEKGASKPQCRTVHSYLSSTMMSPIAIQRENS